MDEIKVIDLKQTILSENKNLADEQREKLRETGTFLLDIMGSPGAGKTTFLLETISRLQAETAVAVIEADIASTIDSEKMAHAGVEVIQLNTGGACHLDIPMVDIALSQLDLLDYDAVVIENVGNLVCPAEFDTGATKRVMLLSVPEGHDKVFKYPLMFTVCDALIVSKLDYLGASDFDMESLRQNAELLNPNLSIFAVSAKTGDGMAEWVTWLSDEIKGVAGIKKGECGLL